MASCKPDYKRIAELELEIYDTIITKSPEAASLGADKEDESIKDYMAKKARDAWAESERLRETQTQWNPGPDWIDDDGRPW